MPNRRRHVPRTGGLSLLALLGLGCGEATAGPDAGRAARLVFHEQPAAMTAGEVPGRPVRVQVLDARGRIVTSSTAQVTIGFAADASGAALRGTVSKRAEGGVATFDDVWTERAGTGYRLSARAPGLGSATSDPFPVLPAAPARLRFLTQPGIGIAGAVLQPPVQLALQDTLGNIVPANAQATIELRGGATGAVLGGTVQRSLQQGSVTFPDLTVDRVGTGYVLAAHASGVAVPGDTTMSFAVIPSALVLTRLAGDGQQGFPGQALRDSLRLRVTDAQGNPVAGVPVQWAASHAATVHPATTITGPDGAAVAALHLPTYDQGVADSLALTVSAGAYGFATEFRATATIGRWNWRFIGKPLGDGEVFGVAVDPEDEQTLYAWGNSLYVTHDGGGRWEHTGIGFTNSDAVELDPLDPRRVYVASQHHVYLSEDRGRSWHLLASLPQPNRSLHVSARDGSIFFAPQWPAVADQSPGIFRSQDGGASYQHLAFGVNPGLQVLTWDIEESPVTGTLFLANEIADHPVPYHPPFFRSVDGGQSWQNVAPAGWWHAIAVQVNPLAGTVYALLEGPGLWWSQDDGASWALVNAKGGLELRLDPLHPHRLYLGDLFGGTLAGGAYLSADGGRRFWRIGLQGGTVGALALDGTSTRLYAAVYRQGIYVVEIPGVVP